MGNPGLKEQIIKLAAEAGVKAALAAIESRTGAFQSLTADDAYKAVERRLRALPILMDKVEYDRERLEECESGAMRDRSKSVVRFNPSGSRIGQEEILEALKQDLTAHIATNEYEIKIVMDALKSIEKDAYYSTVYDRFVLQESDDDIASRIPCESSTMRRHRGRLIRQLAVRLYGADAI